ncbi:MAG: hypothetical protein ACR2O3_03245 [Rhizobiaceae bacterium]
MHAEDRSALAFTLSVSKFLLWSALLYLAWHWRSLPPVLFNSELPGPDDFLRLHQVETFLGGQGWFDTAVHRFAGSDIHWSRIVDVPLALLAYPFTFFMDLTASLRISALIWPFILFLTALFLMMKTCDRLCGKDSRILVLLFTGFNSFTMQEFAPGRVDHHNLQIVLLLLATYGLFARENWKRAFCIGMAIPVSTAIGLEILILFVAVLAGLAWAWVWGKKDEQDLLFKTGVVMGIVSLGLFFLTIPPAQYSAPFCDAFSIVYLALLLGISVGFTGLAFATVKIDSLGTNPVLIRLVSGSIFAVLLAIGLMVQFPQCLSGPLGGLSEELVSRWLSSVTEAKGIFETANLKPERWISGVSYLCLMLVVATGVTIKRYRSHPPLLTLLAVLWICALASIWQMRVLRTGIFSAIPFSVIFAMLMTEKISVRFKKSPALSSALKVVLCLGLTSYAWALLALPFSNISTGETAQKVNPNSIVENIDPEGANLRNPLACFAASDFEELAKLPKGRVMSDLNSAAPLLLHTPHGTISGPYHRNGDQIVAVYDFFQSKSDKASEIALRKKIDYLAACRAGGSIPIVNADHLNAKIFRDELPSWLVWQSKPDARLMVLRVVR